MAKTSLTKTKPKSLGKKQVDHVAELVAAARELESKYSARRSKLIEIGSVTRAAKKAGKSVNDQLADIDQRWDAKSANMADSILRVCLAVRAIKRKPAKKKLVKRAVAKALPLVEGCGVLVAT